MSAGAISLSLEAFERFTTGLHDILKDPELVARTLSLLLQCSSGVVNIDEIFVWCLGDGRLHGDTPVVTARVMLLSLAVQTMATNTQFGTVKFDTRSQFLNAIPNLLTDTCNTAATQLAKFAAQLLSDEGDALEWLRLLRQHGDISVFCRAASALLAAHHHRTVQAEAWELATETMSGPNASDRRTCMRKLLPDLVRLYGKRQWVLNNERSYFNSTNCPLLFIPLKY